MEIDISEDYNDSLSKFKIDLIVWKSPSQKEHVKELISLK